MLCGNLAKEGFQATNSPEHTRRESAPVVSPLLHQGGFALCVLWLIVLPRTLFEQSTSVHAAAALVAAAFVAGMAACTAAALAAPRTLTIASRAGAVVALLCATAFLFTINPLARTALACLELAAGAPLLVWWGMRLASWEHACAARTVCGAFALAGGAALLFSLVGDVSGAGVNVARWSGISLAFAAFLPAASACAGLAGERTEGEREQNEGEDAPLPRRMSERAGALPLFATIAVTSLVVSLFDGFTFVLHQFNMRHAEYLEFSLVLSVCAAVCALMGTSRRAREASPAALLGVPTFILVIVGMVALNIGLSASATVPHGLLLAASDCLLALAMVVLLDFAPRSNAGACPSADAHALRKAPLRPASFALVWTGGLLASGLVYGFCLGIVIRRAFGYDIALLTSIASVCVALFAVAYFTQVGIASARARSAGENAGQAANASQQLQEGSPLAASMDTQTARGVIFDSYKDILASYGLSKREIQIAEHVLEGYDAITIGERLGIQEGTVRYHLTNIYRKADVLSKVELIDLVKGKRGVDDNA